MATLRGPNFFNPSQIMFPINSRHQGLATFWLKLPADVQIALVSNQEVSPKIGDFLAAGGTLLPYVGFKSIGVTRDWRRDQASA